MNNVASCSLNLVNMHLYQQSMLKEGALSEKVIWITGGGTGLGKSMVKSFVDLGPFKK